MAIKKALVDFMASKTGITDLLSTFEGETSIFPHIAPTKAKLSYITLQRISDPIIHHLGGVSGIAKPTFQLDCFAATPDLADDLSEAVRDNLDGRQRISQGSVEFKSMRIMDQDDVIQIPDNATENAIWRIRMDLKIWYNRSVPSLP